MPADTIVYLNGHYVPRCEAHLDIEDRGSTFADGVYEVVRYWNGVGFALDAHVQRLHRSCAAIEIPLNGDLLGVGAICDQVVQRNGMLNASVYVQVTRGVAPRRHAFEPGMTPTLLVIATAGVPFDPQAPIREVSAILHPDERWPHCWIKSLMLLPNVLAKTRAARVGAEEAILHRGGRITEGTSTTVGVVSGGVLWTHPLDGSILPSVTRHMVLELARREGVAVREEAFALTDLPAADEVIIMGTTTLVTAVTGVDERVIGDGTVGPVTRRLHRLLADQIDSVCRR